MSDKEIITIPYKYKPYPHQIDLFAARDKGIRHLMTRWHRRCGKDLSFWNLIIREAVKRKGIYYYVFPMLNQGKKALFEGITNDGTEFLEYIPGPLRSGEPNITDLKIKLSNGSIIQIIGTDKYDKVRGTNPVGVVYSEYAYQNPGARSVIKPILSANNGWEALNSTPNGKNHMYKLEMQINKRLADEIPVDDRWYLSVKNIEETIKHDGSPIITPERVFLEAEDEGWSDEFVQQEYWVSYNANAQGYYYLSYINDMREQGRIGSFPWNPDKPVYTFWDIGVGDSTAIWFMQWIEGRPTIIDFYTNFSVGMEHYAAELMNGRRGKYVYKMHMFPHDMINTEFGTGRTRIEIAEELFGRDRVDMGPKLSFEDGIQASRLFLSKCYINECDETEKGIQALENYQREFNDERKEFSAKPVHNWASHPADAFRYMAVSCERPKEKTYLTKKLQEYRRGLRRKSWLAA
jgi:phage terminase large subunit